MVGLGTVMTAALCVAVGVAIATLDGVGVAVEGNAALGAGLAVGIEVAVMADGVAVITGWVTVEAAAMVVGGGASLQPASMIQVPRANHSKMARQDLE